MIIEQGLNLTLKRFGEDNGCGISGLATFLQMDFEEVLPVAKKYGYTKKRGFPPYIIRQDPDKKNDHKKYRMDPFYFCLEELKPKESEIVKFNAIYRLPSLCWVKAMFDQACDHVVILDTDFDGGVKVLDSSRFGRYTTLDQVLTGLRWSYYLRGRYFKQDLINS